MTQTTMTNFQDSLTAPLSYETTGFNSEQVQKIAQIAVEQVVGVDDVVFQPEKVNQWC